MHAAVVASFGTPPVYREFPAPSPRSPDELVVDVLAAGLHPRVRSQADGSHYTSTDELPLVPGIDGVGRDSDGALRFFILPDTTVGSMAQQTVIDRRRSVVLPDGTDPVLVAAGMNPAMSSWIALRRRIEFHEGQSVLVLGATGNAGRMAVEVARHLGAGRITGVGRDREKLAALGNSGADATFSIGDSLSGETDVDVVLDYLWGAPAAEVMRSLVTDRRDRGKPLSWIQIGSVAGPTAEISSAALRASGLSIEGSGQGSVSTRDILAELPELAAAITDGVFRIDARTVPLADVDQAWRNTASAERVVLIP